MPGLASTPVSNVTPRLAFPARLSGIFFSPTEVFSDIVDDRDFWKPWLLVALLSIVTAEVMLSRFGIATLAHRHLKRSAVARTTEIYQIGVWLATVFGPLLQAATCLLVLRFGLGARVRFRTALSIVCYANLVQIPHQVATALVVLLGDPSGLNPRNPFPSNLVFFLAPSTSGFAFTLAKAVDLFVIWELIILSIGFGRATDGAVKPAAFFKAYLGFQLFLAFLVVRR